jgi:hypothetical protein
VVRSAVVHDDLAKALRFVDKTAEGLRLKLVCAGRHVWEKLRAIPVRRLVTYMELPRCVVDTDADLPATAEASNASVN